MYGGGKVNKPFPQEKFNALKNRIAGYLQGADLYVA
jgi:ATP-dependent phosphoenolpyruvate carboxykinase